MLRLETPSVEIYDEKTGLFATTKKQIISLEHSLVSVSKWESKWKKPFLTKGAKTREETIDYVRCMVVTPNVDSATITVLANRYMGDIFEYIESEMTATKLRNDTQTTSREIITSEVIYYWMVAFNIPFECEKWHLNRLLTLINVCNIKSSPPKKMSAKDIASRNRELNEARKRKLQTGG